MTVDLSYAPRTGESVAGLEHTTDEELRQIIASASQAAMAVAGTAPADRAAWLDGLAGALIENRDELAQIANEETALGAPRLPGEVERAAASARFYGHVAREGSFARVRIDHVSGPPDLVLRSARRPLGPVAVFGASNFPFLFGVVGHDTCSAIAAGCPVVVKAHPAHPRLSARLAQIAQQTLAQAGAPEGTFGIVAGFDAGLALVDAPAIAAVGFTGSQTGGMALVERAATRARPIPVYAEMGTVNPVVVTRQGARKRGDDIADGFVESFTLGTGQFCTKPGLLLAPAGSDLAQKVADRVACNPGGHGLTAGIASAYVNGRSELQAAGAHILAQGSAPDAGYAIPAVVATAAVEQFTAGSRLLGECFGPFALVVDYTDDAERDRVLASLQPSLAGVVASSGSDDPETPELVAALSAQVGRVVVDGWPTGVATTWSQHHGGPWPSTSRPEASSVGASALDRFSRPVAYQDVPEAALPPELKTANPWDLPRRIDGTTCPPRDVRSDTP